MSPKKKAAFSNIAEILGKMSQGEKLDVLRRWGGKEIELPEDRGARVILKGLSRGSTQVWIDYWPAGWDGANPIHSSTSLDSAIGMIAARVLPKRPVENPIHWQHFFEGESEPIPPRRKPTTEESWNAYLKVVGPFDPD